VRHGGEGGEEEMVRVESCGVENDRRKWGAREGAPKGSSVSAMGLKGRKSLPIPKAVPMRRKETTRDPKDSYSVTQCQLGPIALNLAAPTSITVRMTVRDGLPAHAVGRQGDDVREQIAAAMSCIGQQSSAAQDQSSRSLDAGQAYVCCESDEGDARAGVGLA
jgi:hypothetical protein